MVGRQGVSRRCFLAALGMGVLGVGSRATVAQPGTSVPTIGFLRRAPMPAEYAVFEASLASLGWHNGSNIRILQRYADGQAERIPALASELVAANVALLVVDGSVTTLAVLGVTKTVPIISAILSDPARLGITSLRQPGGNLTGLSSFHHELASKRVELIAQIVPGLSRLAGFRSRVNINPETERLTAEAAQRFGLDLRIFDVGGPQDWKAHFAEIVADHRQALVQFSDAVFATRPKELAALALENRLPGVYPEREFGDAGGLLAYGVNIPDLWRRAASYVDRILKGAKPGDLPVEQPTKFDFVVNLKTARALGLTIPTSILAAADEVIE